MIRIYQEPIHVSLLEEALIKLDSSSRDEIILILLGLVDLNDALEVQKIYFNYIYHHDDWIASAAITGLGHLSRVHRNLNKNQIIEELERIIVKRPKLLEKINNTIDDINMFLT